MVYYDKRREASLLLDSIRISKQLEKDKEFVKQAEKLANCCKYKNLFLGEEGFIEIGKGCGYRICNYCSKIRANFYYKQFIDYLKTKNIPRFFNGKGLRFMTLTIKNEKDMIYGINKFYDSLTKLKRRSYFKEKVNGGIGTLEIKKGNDNLWNIHGHFIIDSLYLDMKSHLKKKGSDSKLVQEWKHCTEDSGILDVRKIRGHEGALGYVLKYLTKGIYDLSVEEKVEFFKLTYKRRLIFTFGDFYKIKRPKKKSKLQYIFPWSEEYEAYYMPKIQKNNLPTLDDYEREMN